MRRKNIFGKFMLNTQFTAGVSESMEPPGKFHKGGYGWKKAGIKNSDISMEEITISLVSSHYPRILIRHLIKDRYYHMRKADRGIYYVEGDQIPIQLIVTEKL